MQGEKHYKMGPIDVAKHVIDWNFLEGSVRRRLETLEPNATIYLNPEYSVTTADETAIELFVKQARRAQKLGNARLSRVLGSGNRRRAVKGADPATRQLLFAGVMFIEGHAMHPKGWPDVQTTRKVNSDAR